MVVPPNQVPGVQDWIDVTLTARTFWQVCFSGARLSVQTSICFRVGTVVVWGVQAE
jgi:hypothetical protein